MVVQCNHEKSCFNFPNKCNECKSTSSMVLHYPCLKEKDLVEVTRCYRCKNVIEHYNEITGETYYFCKHTRVCVKQFGYCDRGDNYDR